MEEPTPDESIEEKYLRLLEEHAKLKAELSEKKTIINRARDITPVVRPRANRVFKFLGELGMGLSQVAGGWILECGESFRKFNRLSTVWELLTTDALEIKHIFINEHSLKRAVISMPSQPLVIDNLSSTKEKIKLIEKCAIALSDSMAQTLTDFSLEQVTQALAYYKATIAKGKEIKSATGWLLKCLKEEWYKNFVPEPSPYTPKIFTAADLPQVEAARFPSDFWEKARSHIQGEDRLESLIPF